MIVGSVLLELPRTTFLGDDQGVGLLVGSPEGRDRAVGLVGPDALGTIDLVGVEPRLGGDLGNGGLALGGVLEDGEDALDVLLSLGLHGFFLFCGFPSV